jgi:hypothetical protein
LTASSVSAQSICDCFGTDPRECIIQISSQTDLNDLALANCTSIYGSLTIASSNLTDLDGLESLEGISGTLTIRNNLALTNLNGLQNLTLVGWNLKIIENPVLASIAGLSSLETLDGDVVEINGNSSIDDLTPLYGVQLSGNYLIISYNQILSTADAYALVAELSPPNGIFNGFSKVLYNGFLDLDNDGTSDVDDNCPTVWNSDQADSDGDSIGDFCDACPNDADNDADSDGICGDVDNCPVNCNLNQLDADGDDIGDVCDVTPGCGGCGQDICETEC